MCSRLKENLQLANSFTQFEAFSQLETNQTWAFLLVLPQWLLVHSIHFLINLNILVTFSQCNHKRIVIPYCCCSSVTQLCPNIYNFMNCSTPSFPVLFQLLELAQIHVHWVSETIWPFYPLSSPSPPAFNLSQHQGLFQWVGSWHQMAKVLELQLQHQSFQWVFRESIVVSVLWYKMTLAPRLPSKGTHFPRPSPDYDAGLRFGSPHTMVPPPRHPLPHNQDIIELNWSTSSLSLGLDLLTY